MKAYLMYRDHDVDLEQSAPPNADTLMQDLELSTLLNAMALEDAFLLDVTRKALLVNLRDPDEMIYRQRVLADCLEHAATVREIYDIAVQAVQAERKVWSFWAKSPDSILHRSVQVLEILVGALKRLRKIAETAEGRFHSEGFTRFFTMLTSELSDDYFQEIDAHLRELKFPRGVLLSAELGAGAKGAHYVLRRAREQRWIERIAPGKRSGYSFHLADRDESGFQALEELRGKGINLVANALAQSTDHIVSFFGMLRTELAFYVGCLNLHARVSAYGAPLCMPTVEVADTHSLSAEGLYDVCLSLQLQAGVVGNALNADETSLVLITGANQGGKSTFLRSVGVAYLMMQCGMFTPAASFRASVCDGVFTHYKREEDATMQSGKLDEELRRMSEIADMITPNALLLCNESFAATNEREGSEIARQIIRALREEGVSVFFVTHLYDLAHGFYAQEHREEHSEEQSRAHRSTLFLRAERRPDGQRTFRVVEGEPLPTSYGEDSYQRIFGEVDTASV